MTYYWYKTANNVTSSLVSSISWSTTTIIVNDWNIFPSTFPYMLTIEQKLNGQTVVREIVKVTARTWNTMTVVRAVESCVSDDTASPKTLSQIAHNFNANALVSLNMTAWVLQDCQQWITDNANDISDANDAIDDINHRIQQIEADIGNL